MLIGEAVVSKRSFINGELYADSLASWIWVAKESGKACNKLCVTQTLQLSVPVLG